MRAQEARALRTAGERPLAKADAQSASSESMSEGERKPPRSPAVSDLAALALLALLEQHTFDLRVVMEEVREGEIPPHVLSAIKEHAASCERLTRALGAG